MKTKTIDVPLHTIHRVEAREQTSIEHKELESAQIADVLVFRHQPADEHDSKGVATTPKPITVEVLVTRIERTMSASPRVVVHFEPRQRSLADLFVGGGIAR